MRANTVTFSIPITKPFFGREEEEALTDVLRSGWIAQGSRVAQFERTVAEYVGVRHAVATSSCTTALHLALVLHGIGPGDEVILPSFTFIATANSVCYTGATPVFVDIDPQTYNLDPAHIEAAITPRTKAIMPVHQIGLAADMDRINGIARSHGLAVIEDAAPSLGATYKGKCVGSLGNLTCFSFHPRKVITTGEGGVILTDDRMLPERARVVRAHGMSVSDLVRHQAKSVVIEEYRELGYNYRMTDLQAAVGIEQMKKLDFILVRRQELAARYNDALAKLECVQLPYSPPETPHTYQSYMVQLTPQTPKTRDQVMREMLEAGVATRPGVMAIHLTHYYRTRFPDLRLPITERATRSTVLLPIYPGMSDADQEYVINNLIRVLR
jgi:dTDP-4-amino-4,6-dideoxygalactose transaminase